MLFISYKITPTRTGSTGLNRNGETSIHVLLKTEGLKKIFTSPSLHRLALCRGTPPLIHLSWKLKVFSGLFWRCISCKYMCPFFFFFYNAPKYMPIFKCLNLLRSLTLASSQGHRCSVVFICLLISSSQAPTHLKSPWSSLTLRPPSIAFIRLQLNIQTMPPFLSVPWVRQDRNHSFAQLPDKPEYSKLYSMSWVKNQELGLCHPV